MAAAQIFAVDPDPFRFEFAECSSATKTMHPDDNPVEVIRQGTIHEAFGRLRTNAYNIIRDSPCPVLSV
jgi:hypothetical protein